MFLFLCPIHWNQITETLCESIDLNMELKGKYEAKEEIW